ncbi:MAG: hypothetical protein CMI09_09985 [Oceanospirillaceae bacterium]|nr:hypothetical protein [Oceanospirillaceae bacterium]|tara:strand:+ start:1463 stop:3709 length:2247 start_codon:yes stop_codon:yes gene_type:complete
MSKLKKLFKTPKLFFKDAVDKKKSGRSVLTSLGSEPKPKPKPKPKPNLIEEIDNLFDLEYEIGSESVGKFLYFPWIPSHGDKLFSMISKDIVPVSIFKKINKSGQRSEIIKFVRSNPKIYRKLIFRILAPVAKSSCGIVLSLDWTPPMREVVHVCKKMNILTVLIPHEGVYADRCRFYRDVVGGASIPICDFLLVWGEDQYNIFSERGYPENRIKITGSPKLDFYKNGMPLVDKDVFFGVFCFDLEIPLIVFVAQPLDSQFDQNIARETQRKIIWDLIDYCESRNYQLLLRCPPADSGVLNMELRKKFESFDYLYIDEPPLYLVSPEDTIFHSNIVVSINSTMLLEASLADKPAIGVQYMKFESMWKKLGIPLPESKEELFHSLDANTLLGKAIASETGMKWVDKILSNPGVKSATENINSELAELSDYWKSQRRGECLNNGFMEEIKPFLINVGIHAEITKKTKYVPEMLDLQDFSVAHDIVSAQSKDLFVKWGIAETQSKIKQDRFVRSLGRKQIIIEDGFIRSIETGLQGSPALSITVDDVTAYYDAINCSRLEQRMQSDHLLSHDCIERAKRCISMLREFKITKYNHAPYVDSLNLGSNDNKVLVVDQRFGDMSVERGMADLKSFEKMLVRAIQDNPESDIVVKLHPDALISGKNSYLDGFEFIKEIDRVIIVDFNINPHVLFEKCSKVYVVTSGMGFEAAISGCEVHCFGVPYYSGWGVTVDYVDFPRRTRERTLEDVTLPKN